MTDTQMVLVSSDEDLFELEGDGDPKWITSPAHDFDRQNTKNVLEALGFEIKKEQREAGE